MYDLRMAISLRNMNHSSTSPFTHRALPPLPSLPLSTLNRTNHDNVNVGHDDNDDNAAEIINYNIGDNDNDNTNNNYNVNGNGIDGQSNSDVHHQRLQERQKFLDYAASIERVKDCGWYWGPISGEMAEKLLASEPDGSFIVRDSSDEHYIFSLTFKLNGLVRHVRIEHDQGNFSFGSLQKFRSNTIVDFIENVVQHSRSGRFLFFLHRGPVMGPMRVQLLHPVSRFKQIQSLKHVCRFVILKYVRRDLIDELPIPKTLKSYLNTPFYYSDKLAVMTNIEDANQILPLKTSQ